MCCDIERTLVHALGMWGIVEKLWVYIRKIDCMSKEKSMLTKFALWFCVVCVVPLLGVAQETDSGKEQRSVKGRVFDENREPMAGVLPSDEATAVNVPGWPAVRVLKMSFVAVPFLRMAGAPR